MRDSDKKRALRLFAMGMLPEAVAEIMEHSAAETGKKRVSQLEKLLQMYVTLPLDEKLRLTLLPEWVSNRTHRLMDDIADLKRIDALLTTTTDEKKLVALLDIKRRIKERMAKEDTTGSERGLRAVDGEMGDEFDRCYRKVFGVPPPQE